MTTLHENHSPLATSHSPLMLRGTLRHDEPLARHTSWRVGGPATHFYQPADVDDLALFLRQLPPQETLLWLGLGSNLLVRDGGVRGTVIATSGMLNGLELLNARILRAEAGVACAKVARFSAQHDMSDAEFLAGIPGTMGGALAMNAGAFGGETWRIVERVETLDRRGERRVRTPADYDIDYRKVALKTVRSAATPVRSEESGVRSTATPVRGEELGVRSNTSPLTPHTSLAEGPGQEWFIAAHLHLTPGAGGTAKARIKALLERRNLTQPTQQPNAGSVFRNPPGDHAARLIESAGLKGLRVGGACVSEKHANFIINTGQATAADIETLIQHIMHTVQQRHGVQLVPEVHIVGEKL